MSNLQIGLAVAGGLVLTAVVAHGAWTSRKNTPRQPQPELADAMPGTEPREPRFHADLATEVAADAEPSGFAIPAPEKKPGLDALIDVIATLALESPASGDAALAAMPATRRVGSKPFAIEGLNSASAHWETPAPGQRYSAFQTGVQPLRGAQRH
jgi:hypothetical protein